MGVLMCCKLILCQLQYCNVGRYFIGIHFNFFLESFNIFKLTEIHCKVQEVNCIFFFFLQWKEKDVTNSITFHLVIFRDSIKSNFLNL